MSANKYYRVEERFQRTARSRRVRQQLHDGFFDSFKVYTAALDSIEADYAKKDSLPAFATPTFDEVMEEEK